jgi:hypothetical protein
MKDGQEGIHENIPQYTKPSECVALKRAVLFEYGCVKLLTIKQTNKQTNSMV